MGCGDVYQDLRPRRPVRCGAEGQHRPQTAAWAAAGASASVPGTPSRPTSDETNDDSEPEDRRVRQGGGGRAAPLPYQHWSSTCRPTATATRENDAAIVPDVGMFASFDPVALDMACVDAVNAQPVMRGSAADGGDAHDHDHFHRIHPETDWISCLEHAEKIGIGTRAYELIKI